MRYRQFYVEFPEHVEIKGLFDQLAAAAFEWEQEHYPQRDGWDINVGSTVVEELS